jgi:serine/threonine protein kinase
MKACIRCGYQPSPGSKGVEDGRCLCGGSLQDDPIIPSVAHPTEADEHHAFKSEELILEVKRGGAVAMEARRLRQDEITIGRNPASDITLYNYDSAVKRTTSDRHCSIFKRGRSWYVRNDSTNNVVRIDSHQIAPGATERLTFPTVLVLGHEGLLSLAIWRETTPLENGNEGTERGWMRRHEHTGKHWIVVFSRHRQDVDSADVTLRMPAVIGNRYEIVDVLSNGGFGVIYIALDRRLRGRQVLVKSRRYDQDKIHFRGPNNIDRAALITGRRGEVEFEAVALLLMKELNEGRVPLLIDVVRGFSPQLWGPHFLTHDESAGPGQENVWYWDDPAVDLEPYLILQWIAGETLDSLIAREARLTETSWRRRALRFTLEMTGILEVLHGTSAIRSSGVMRRDDQKYYFIYQDLKPANVLVTAVEFLTLIDFGATLYIQQSDTGAWDSCIQGMGEPGVGTAGYKPLEMDVTRANLHTLDQRVDIYTLGASLFYMLTGEDPSTIAPEYGPLPVYLLKSSPPQVARMQVPLPNEIVAFLDRALAQDRASRFSTMTEMRDALLPLFNLL